MTPEKARELLDGDPKTETRTEWVGDVQAETVAGLWYEYAVQVPVNGHWKYTKDEQYGPELVSNHRDATWYPNLSTAAVWADLWDDGKEKPRIVRRLVSEPEVSEQ